MKQRHKYHFKKQNQSRIPRGISIGLAVVTVVAGSSLVVPHISQSFTDTNQTPPQGNVEAPINISGDDQWKEGNLGVGTDSFPEATLDVGGNVNIRSGEGFVTTDDVFVRNADPVNGSKLLTDLLKNKSKTPSLDVVLDEGNISGGTQINMQNTKIVNVAPPSNPADVATKEYVDEQISQIQGPEGPSGGPSIDVSITELNTFDIEQRRFRTPKLYFNSIGEGVIYSLQNSVNAVIGLIERSGISYINKDIRGASYDNYSASKRIFDSRGFVYEIISGRRSRLDIVNLNNSSYNRTFVEIGSDKEFTSVTLRGTQLYIADTNGRVYEASFTGDGRGESNLPSGPIKAQSKGVIVGSQVTTLSGSTLLENKQSLNRTNFASVNDVIGRGVYNPSSGRAFSTSGNTIYKYNLIGNSARRTARSTFENLGLSTAGIDFGKDTPYIVAVRYDQNIGNVRTIVSVYTKDSLQFVTQKELSGYASVYDIKVRGSVLYVLANNKLGIYSIR